MYILGLRFASLASLGWGHSQLSREFVCLGFRHFLKFSPDIFITFSETSSNYVWTLIVSINNQIKELKNWLINWLIKKKIPKRNFQYKVNTYMQAELTPTGGKPA